MAIQLSNVTKKYGSEYALNNVTLHFNPGKFMGCSVRMAVVNRLL